MKEHSSTLSVYGDIKSIFEYHRDYLDGLGVFYVPWGVCGSSQEDLWSCEQIEDASGSM